MSHWFIHSTNSLKTLLCLKSLTHLLGRAIQAHYGEKTWREISQRIRIIGDSLYEWIIESFIQVILSNLHTTAVCCSETQGGRNLNFFRWWNERKQSIWRCCAYNGKLFRIYLLFIEKLYESAISAQHSTFRATALLVVWYCLCVLQDVCTNLWLRHECALQWVGFPECCVVGVGNRFQKESILRYWELRIDSKVWNRSH